MEKHWVNEIFGERVGFHRYSEQCRNCTCFTENIPPEDIDEWAREAIELLECTLEQPCMSKEPCIFYSLIERD